MEDYQLFHTIIPDDVLQTLSFDTLWQMKPTTLGKVYNRLRSEEQEVVCAHRYYAVFGKTPNRTEDAVTYMFSSSGIAPENEIPKVLLPLLDHLNAMADDPRYNQIVVNWYETAEEYTPYHKDCTTGMREGASVGIVTLLDVNEHSSSSKALREVVFKKPRHCVRFPTTHGSYIRFGGDVLHHWWHGAPRGTGDVCRRISISFRSYV